jgi:hypothetical protein
MSKYQTLNSEFWSDDYSANLDPIEKLLFIYLLTNSHSNIAGAYQLPIKTMAVETGIDRDMVAKIIGRFVADKKLLFQNGWIAVRNKYKYNNLENPKIKVGVDFILKSCPSFVIDFIEQNPIDKLSISPERSHSNSHSNLDLSLNQLIETYWLNSPISCKLKGNIIKARNEFEILLAGGISFDTINEAIKKAPKESRPWEIIPTKKSGKHAPNMSVGSGDWGSKPEDTL